MFLIHPSSADDIKIATKKDVIVFLCFFAFSNYDIFLIFFYFLVRLENEKENFVC